MKKRQISYFNKKKIQKISSYLKAEINNDTKVKIQSLISKLTPSGIRINIDSIKL